MPLDHGQNIDLNSPEGRALARTYGLPVPEEAAVAQEKEGPRKAGRGAVTLSLPWPPSVNHYWRHTGLKVVTSKAGREYRKAVSGIVTEAWCRDEAYEMYGRLSVTVVASPPDRRARDLDNILKSLLDALEHAGLYRSDSQIDRLLVVRGTPSPPLGSVSVRVAQLQEAP